MLSIVIITKNEEKYLPKLLESLNRQTFKDFEIVVSDANSKDKTREIAKQYGCKIVDGGKPARGRNKGAKAAKNDLLLFLDADVVLPSDFLKDGLKEFKERRLDCATTVYKPISEKKVDKIMHSVSNVLLKSAQYMVPHAGGFCILCKKQAFDKAGGFDENLYLCEDHDFVSKISKQGYKFRLLKNNPIYVSVRRLDKEGRFKIAAKYTYSTLYRLFYKDIDKEIFEYNFNHK